MLNEQIKVNIDLLKKYDKSGPRYTSYPTAPYFHPGIGSVEYEQQIIKENRDKADESLSLYFHLPFCDTLCYFCGCNMMVTRNRPKIDEYIEYLNKEMGIIKKLLSPKRKVLQMHWGGGTPTHLDPQQIRKLGGYIRNHFEFEDDAEISVEIDPRELQKEHLVALREIGFNRVSMGVQDFDPKVQETVNRVQPEALTRRVVDWTKELGFVSINLDLMYGLPFQTTATFEDTVEKTLKLNPDRLAVFNYAHLPSMIKHQKLIQDEWLPSADIKLQLLKMSIEKLTANGFVYIGMDHFAKPDDELTHAMQQGNLYRNFQGYSTHAGLNVLAIGMTSISMLSDMYVQNQKDLKHYYEALDEGRLPVARGVLLNEDDLLRREVITELMCNFTLVKARIEEKYAIKFDAYFAEALAALQPFEADALIILQKDKITVTQSGRLLIRNIAMNFDAYLAKKEDNKPQFSKTI